MLRQIIDPKQDSPPIFKWGMLLVLLFIIGMLIMVCHSDSGGDWHALGTSIFAPIYLLLRHIISEFRPPPKLKFLINALTAIWVIAGIIYFGLQLIQSR